MSGIGGVDTKSKSTSTEIQLDEELSDAARLDGDLGRGR